MTKHRRFALFSVLALGWLLDLLFWRQPPGLNFAVYAALCLGVGFVLLRYEGVRPGGRSLWLVPLILAFAATTFIRAEPLTVFLGVSLTLLLMGVLAITYSGGRWLQFNFLDYILGLLRLAWSTVSLPFVFLRERPAPGSGGRNLFWPVLRGVLLALPVLMVFAALLSSADLVFQQELQDLARLFRLERLPEYIFRLLYVLAAAAALLGVYLHAARRSDALSEKSGGRRGEAGILGFTEAAVVLGSVALLFGAFVIVQFRYFFGGQANIGVEGFTYSEYARRGYGELLAVAFFSLLLILGLGALARRASILQKRVFSGLGVLIVALVAVMLVSALMRLTLYEHAYGFSRLRTYVHVSLIWLGILLAAVVLLEVLGREQLSAGASLLAAVGFALTLAFLNVDAFVVRQNVARAVRGEELDVAYLVTLSDDSVPPLVQLFSTPALPGITHEQIGAALACRLHSPGGMTRTDWRSWTLASQQASRLLELVRSDLEDYSFMQTDRPGRVVTPAGAAIDCLPAWD